MSNKNIKSITESTAAKSVSSSIGAPDSVNEAPIVSAPLTTLIQNGEPQVMPMSVDTSTPIATKEPMPIPEAPVEPMPQVKLEIPTPGSVMPEQSIQPPEIQVESATETPLEGELLSSETEESPAPSKSSRTTTQATADTQLATTQKTSERMQIEEVLARGLVDVYKAMTPQEQQAFRAKGEEVSTAVEQMVTNFRATTKKVLTLIRDWLRLIPRVNHYFLEQESKIKTDDILDLQRKLKKERRNRIDIQ